MSADTKQILAAIRAMRAQLDTFESALLADPMPGRMSLTAAVRTLLAEQPDIAGADAIARLAPLGYNVSSIKSSVSRLRPWRHDRGTALAAIAAHRGRGDA